MNELTSANNQLMMVKTKLEKEFGQVSKDYDDIARELKLADDRANKAGSDAHHFESLLREEQVKVYFLKVYFLKVYFPKVYFLKVYFLKV